MKIKKTLFWISFLLFFLLLPSGIFFLSNLAFWPGNNYIFSHNLNRHLERFFRNNDKIELKKWDYYYRLWEYQKALEKYTKIDCKIDSLCIILYYNLGNTYYRLWEYSQQSTDKVGFWQHALSTYQKALQLQEDEKTRKNYEFVLKKLNDFMQEMKKKQEEKDDSQLNPPQEEEEKWENETSQTDEKEKEQENETSPSSEKPEEKSQESQPQEQTSDQIQPRGPSIKIDENAPESSKELTQEQKEQIQWYIEQLKQEEKNNIHLNKPREQQDIFDILRDDFIFGWMKQNQSGW